jgi:hypothetical protein
MVVLVFSYIVARRTVGTQRPRDGRIQQDVPGQKLGKYVLAEKFSFRELDGVVYAVRAEMF